MFLPHIQTAEPAPVIVSPAIVSPIPIIVSRRTSPNLDRGCCLDVLSGNSWFPVSFHHTIGDAIKAFHALPYHFLWGNVQERWRILCHRLDLGEFATVATEQPQDVWEQ